MMEKSERLNLEFEDDDQSKDVKSLEKEEKSKISEIELDFSAHTHETQVGSLKESSAHQTTMTPENIHVLKSQSQSQKDKKNHKLVEMPLERKNSYELGNEFKKLSSNNPLLLAEFEAYFQINLQKKITQIEATQAQKAKALEIKIDRLLSKILTKAPHVKKELIRIKKLLIENSKIAEPSPLSSSFGRSSRDSSLKKKAS